MNFLRQDITRSKGSPGVAVLFVVIAVAGMMLMASTFRSQDNAASPPQAYPAVDSSSVPVEPMRTKGNYSHYLVRVAAVTGALIVLGLLGAKWYRKRMVRSGVGSLQMAVRGRFYLSPKHSLVVLSVDNRRLLLGVTDNNINLITEFYGEEEAPELPEKSSAQQDTFKALLNRMRSRQT